MAAVATDQRTSQLGDQLKSILNESSHSALPVVASINPRTTDLTSLRARAARVPLLVRLIGDGSREPITVVTAVRKFQTTSLADEFGRFMTAASAPRLVEERRIVTTIAPDIDLTDDEDIVRLSDEEEMPGGGTGGGRVQASATRHGVEAKKPLDPSPVARKIRRVTSPFVAPTQTPETPVSKEQLVRSESIPTIQVGTGADQRLISTEEVLSGAQEMALKVREAQMLRLVSQVGIEAVEAAMTRQQSVLESHGTAGRDASTIANAQAKLVEDAAVLQRIGFPISLAPTTSANLEASTGLNLGGGAGSVDSKPRVVETQTWQRRRVRTVVTTSVVASTAASMDIGISL